MEARSVRTIVGWRTLARELDLAPWQARRLVSIARIWALTHAAAMGALNMAMTVPLGVGVSISYAAMDFREAQDELEWARPDIRGAAAPVQFGALRPDDVPEAREVLDRLAASALNRAAGLAEIETDLGAQAALSRVMARLITGRAKIRGRWA